MTKEIEFLAYLDAVFMQDYELRQTERDGLETAIAFQRTVNRMVVAHNDNGEIRTFEIIVRETQDAIPDWVVEDLHAVQA